MNPGELKPILAALVLPPAAPLLLALAGLLLARWWRRSGHLLVLAGIVLAWLLSTNGMALVLARHLQPEVATLQPRLLQQVQAIVVLGGGVLPTAPEYGVAQPELTTLGRLRYGARLARQSGKPLAFAGGVGWGAAGIQTEAEASVARRVLREDYGLPLRWADERSRDTAENAARMAELLLPQGVRRIALVTDFSHIPRAAAAFRRQGFEVLPAPTGFPVPLARPLLEWLPSATGAATCRTLVREWLARWVARLA